MQKTKEINLNYHGVNLIIEGYHNKRYVPQSYDLPLDKEEFEIKKITICDGDFGEITINQHDIESECIDYLRE